MERRGNYGPLSAHKRPYPGLEERDEGDTPASCVDVIWRALWSGQRVPDNSIRASNMRGQQWPNCGRLLIECCAGPGGLIINNSSYLADIVLDDGEGNQA